MQPVKTALASFGMSSKVFHAPLLHVNERFEIRKIMERSGNKSQGSYPYARIVRDFQDLCNDDDIELIIVNTPDHTHYDLARAAILAGKNVIVEKPFTLKHSHALELADLARNKPVMLSVFQNRRWDGDFLTLQKVIEGNHLGKIVEFESHFDRFRNFIKEDTWKEDASTGTGNLYNLGSHLIDQAMVLFGKPHSVTADVRIMRPGGSIDDSFELWLGYDDLKVTVSGSMLVREPGPRFALHGTGGSFLKWGLDPQEEALNKGFLPEGQEWGAEEESDWGVIHSSLGGSVFRGTFETLPGNYQEYYDDIYRAIRNKTEPLVTPDQAALTIRVIEAALESSRIKASVII